MDLKTLQLLEGFAHELRTPLSAIAGHSSLLTLGVHGPLTEAQSRALMRIEDNKAQMINMIGSVLRYAEAASAVTTHPVARIPLRPIVAMEVAAHAAAAEENGVQLEWLDDHVAVASAEADGSGCDVACISESTTREVVAIMLEDALAHSERDGRVQVRLYCTEETLRVAVESGAPTQVDRVAELLFEPYARDADGRSVYAPGHALSLPRARALARSVGAEVTALFSNSRRILQFDVRRFVNLGTLAG